MPAPASLKRSLKRSKWATVAGRIARDRSWMLRERFGIGNPTGAMGATHRDSVVADSVDYIERVFNDYLRYSGLKTTDLEDKSVLELGPGDSYGVALRFIAAGARRVQTVDRVVAWRDPGYQRRIYEALLARLDPEGRRRVEAVLSMDGDAVAFDPGRLRMREGVPIEEAASELEPGSFDMIVSRAVVEHIYDTDTAFAEMSTLLAPGGTLAHKVDMRDHGLFSGEGLHPLTFLTIPAPLYRMMVENTGQPNRKFLPYYRALMGSLGFDARFWITHLIGREEEIEPHVEIVPEVDMAPAAALAEEIRGKLREPYRSMPAEDLAVSGVFIVATQAGLRQTE
jgi:SAM-dependent methyltransferase